MNVYINLPVADLARSRAFFEALGFSFDDRFCNDEAIGMKISDTSFAMLLTHEKFATFTPRAIADASKTVEALIAIQLDSREAVDEIMATAVANGGAAHRPPEDHGFMYGHAFSDPDGHVWEPFWFNIDAMPQTGDAPEKATA